MARNLGLTFAVFGALVYSLLPSADMSRTQESIASTSASMVTHAFHIAFAVVAAVAAAAAFAASRVPKVTLWAKPGARVQSDVG